MITGKRKHLGLRLSSYLGLGTTIAILLIVVPNAFALRDDFNDGSIDASLWTTLLPFSGGSFGVSALTESGGSLLFQNRGTLITKQDFGAVDIYGRFTISGSTEDMFKVVLRTDGSFTGEHNESANGIAVRFGHVGYNSYNIEFEHRVTPQNGIALADATYTINMNTAYDFRITDNGSQIAFYITDFNTPVLTTTTSIDEGNKIVLYNRERELGVNMKTSLDYIQITPEPSTSCLLGVGLLMLSTRRRQRQA